MATLGRTVPAHRVRTASQLRENSWGSPWYAACSLVGHAGAPERAHQGGTGMRKKRLAITRGKRSEINRRRHLIVRVSR